MFLYARACASVGICNVFPAYLIVIVYFSWKHKVKAEKQ